MTVRVRLFAMLRQQAGREWIDLELAPHATVADALAALRSQARLEDLLDRLPVALAVNRDYASPDTPLGPQDELALIPPLSGGAAAAPHVRIAAEPLRAHDLIEAVCDPRSGAVVVFQGVTRELDALDYEAYAPMAHERIAAILTQCIERHGLTAAAAEHRTGRVPLGEASVIVAVSAPHREPAFRAAREAIDAIKRQAPIWKRELHGQRSRWVEGQAPPQHADTALTHLDGDGRARMVDVGSKRVSERRAVARARVRMSPATAAAVLAGDTPKGEVLSTARLAGVLAAKRTAELIPLAHPISPTFIDVSARVEVGEGVVELLAEARIAERTGVEMEAMTACAVAALTVYDMVKGLERGVRIEQLALLEKTGGRSDWRAECLLEG